MDNKSQKQSGAKGTDESAATLTLQLRLEDGESLTPSSIRKDKGKGWEDWVLDTVQALDIQIQQMEEEIKSLR